jgi:uncharacterized membrane-anchored protein
MTLSNMTLSTSRVVWISLLLMTTSAPSMGQQPGGQDSVDAHIKKLGWQSGPSDGKIAGRATIAIPAKYVFLGAADTSKFLTLMRNLPRTDSYTFAPQNLDWFSIFDFDETGYIKDDEKIDADAVLQSLKEGTARNNEERKKRGYPVLSLDGWFVPPHYDTGTKRLEWATKLSSESGGVSVNYRIRILGRAGVMSAVLVSDPDSLDKDIRVFKTALNDFSFDSGQRYAEYRPGDKIAEYGLTGLIIGGAAAAAAKTGLFKVIGKFAIYLFAGAVAIVGGLVKRLFSRRTAA